MDAAPEPAKLHCVTIDADLTFEMAVALGHSTPKIVGVGALVIVTPGVLLDRSAGVAARQLKADAARCIGGRPLVWVPGLTPAPRVGCSARLDPRVPWSCSHATLGL